MELRNQNMPKTFFDRKAYELTQAGIGSVRACPFYQIPSSPSSTTPVQSEYAYAGRVFDTIGDMVLVRFEWESVPGEREQLFHPYEIHRDGCICRACKGDNRYAASLV